MAMLTMLSTEDLIPRDHPIRRIRVVVERSSESWIRSSMRCTTSGAVAASHPRRC